MALAQQAFVWSDEITETAKIHWIAGKSGGDVAKLIGKPGAWPSRAAVISKMTRAGLARPAATTKATNTRGGPRPAPNPINFHRDGQARTLEIQPPSQVRYRCEPLPGSEPVNILALRLDGCRWMVSLDGEDLYCGQPADASRQASYCPAHAERAFKAPPVSTKRYIRSALRAAQ